MNSANNTARTANLNAVDARDVAIIAETVSERTPSGFTAVVVFTHNGERVALWGSTVEHLRTYAASGQHCEFGVFADATFYAATKARINGAAVSGFVHTWVKA